MEKAFSAFSVFQASLKFQNGWQLKHAAMFSCSRPRSKKSKHLTTPLHFNRSVALVWGRNHSRLMLQGDLEKSKVIARNDITNITNRFTECCFRRIRIIIVQCTFLLMNSSLLIFLCHVILTFRWWPEVLPKVVCVICFVCTHCLLLLHELASCQGACTPPAGSLAWWTTLLESSTCRDGGACTLHPCLVS